MDACWASDGGAGLAARVCQVGAVEGLSLLSGIALAGHVISVRDVASPIILITAFRQLVHPGLEWLFAYRVDFGTAHLWFVLMLGIGRALCYPLSRLPRRAARHRLGLVLALLLWRLLLAPIHIGFHGERMAPP